jgi:hypothetical protein
MLKAPLKQYMDAMRLQEAQMVHSLRSHGINVIVGAVQH